MMFRSHLAIRKSEVGSCRLSTGLGRRRNSTSPLSIEVGELPLPAKRQWGCEDFLRKQEYDCVLEPLLSPMPPNPASNEHQAKMSIQLASWSPERSEQFVPGKYFIHRNFIEWLQPHSPEWTFHSPKNDVKVNQKKAVTPSQSNLEHPEWLYSCRALIHDPFQPLFHGLKRMPSIALAKIMQNHYAPVSNPESDHVGADGKSMPWANCLRNDLSKASTKVTDKTTATTSLNMSFRDMGRAYNT